MTILKKDRFQENYTLFVIKKIKFILNFYIFSYKLELTKDLDKLNSEIHRILKPGGINIYTVRNTDDGDYKKGIHRGEDLYEIDGFIIHFFSKKTIQNLINGYENLSIDYFEEGSFPRKLFFVYNKKKN